MWPLVDRTLDNGTNDNDQEDKLEEKVGNLQQVGEDLETWRLSRKTMWKFLVTTEFPYMYNRTP